CRLFCKLQHCKCFGRLLTTNEVDDAPSLARRNAQVTRLSLGFHRFLLSYLGSKESPASAAATLAIVLFVATERPCRCALAELVSDHRLSDEDGDMLASVVYRDGASQEVWAAHRPATPCFADLLPVLLVLTSHLLVEVFVDERTLLEATRHKSVLQSALLAGPATPHDVLVALLVRPACAAFQLTPRADWVTTTRGPALATAVRVVDRVHHDTAHGRALALPTHAACFAPADVRLLGIADLADGRTAAGIDVADLA